MNELLVKLKDAINAVPCKSCGKMHTVSLTPYGNEHRPTIVYDFSSDACEDFKAAAKAFVTHWLTSKGYNVTAL